MNLGLAVRHNASSVARELSDVGNRLDRVPLAATTEAVAVLERDVADEIRDIAGGVYWDIDSDVSPTADGARGSVVTPRSKPHRIEPTKPHGLLVFEGVGGNTVFVRGGVDHPGSKPVDWVGPVSRESPRTLRPIFEDAVSDAIRGGSAGTGAFPSSARGL